MVHLAQTVHLSCTNTNTISKWTKTRFHMTLITLEFHRVRPKWFLSLWNVWRESCTYLALKLTQSPNRPKWDSRWPTSPKSSIGCIQTDLWACGMLAQNVHLSCVYLEINRNKLPLEPCYLAVPSCVSKMIFEPMVHSSQTMHLSCINANTISKRTKTWFHMTCVT
jgi:hypothetical protein